MVHFFMWFPFQRGTTHKETNLLLLELFLLFKSRPNLKWTLHPGKRGKVYFFRSSLRCLTPPPPPWSHSATTGCEAKLYRKRYTTSQKSGRTRNSSLACSNVVPNRATFEYSYSVSFIRTKSTNRATW